MIYTVTLNPSIDYVVQVQNIELGKLNKIDHDLKFPGGKGINVSRILHELGTDTTALGFLGGFTGNFIADWLKKDGITTDFISIQDDTRINIKLKSNTETEINGRGPKIQKEEAMQLVQQLTKLTKDDVVVLSGSKPPSVQDDFYQQLIMKITESDAMFVIDTTGSDLMNSLKYKPLLIKPNKEELAELFQTSINTEEDVIPYGEELLQLGARHVIISMAGEGALLFTKDGIFKGNNPTGTVKNSVGAGDSMIAGFVGEYLKTNDVQQAFKMGLASGSATAFTDDLATKGKIHALLDQATVQQIN